MEYKNSYDENYYHSCCGPIPYEEPGQWNAFFGMVADNIIKNYNPKTVLDVGCAMGYLVTALRDRGVEAYGVDVSEYAISKVREDIKPFCQVASALEPFPLELPQKYDLLTTIEVIEHLYEEDCEKFIENICNYSDTILFSSTPDDVEEKTHYNVQQSEYWCKRFAKAGYYNNLDNSPNYITYHAKEFYKTNEIARVVEDYERYFRLKDKEISKEREAFIKERESFTKEQASFFVEIDKLKQKIVTYESNVKEVNKNNKELDIKLMQAQNNYVAVLNSTCWRCSGPFRNISSFMKWILKSNPITRNLCKGLISLKRDGLKQTLNKIKNKVEHIKGSKNVVNNIKLSKKEYKKQRNTTFPKKIKFSVLVPLYNTPEKFLVEMMESVIKQTYMEWELCLADGSDENHCFVEKICRKYSQKDQRIIYKKLERNLGISENTNECIEMSTGDYIVLFDHDDILHPSALYENMKMICEKNADFIYSDEDKVSEDGKKFFEQHFKPDFSIYNLRSNNYICHLTVFEKKLLDSAGKFRAEYNGSQDHDIVFRLVENAKNIVHIPKILYHWRVSSASVASDPYAKPYTIVAGINAVSDHLKRAGIEAEVKSSDVHPNIYDIKYKLKANPLVSIIVANKDHIVDLSTLLKSLKQKTTYSNYEIIIVENNSENEETFNFYESIEKEEKISVVKWDKYFNYSLINNFGVENSSGEHLLFLNNDTEIISPNWIQEMLMYSQFSDVGAVGAKLYYPDDTIQHAGVGIGLLTLAGHYYRGFQKTHPGYMGRLAYVQNVSCVTAACMMMPRHVFDEIGGFDEKFAVAFNDVDLCLRIRAAGYNIVWTPYAELYHYESKSRGFDNTPEKQKRFEGEVLRFQSRWKKELEEGDPYYNPNLTLDREDFSMK